MNREDETLETLEARALKLHQQNAERTPPGYGLLEYAHAAAEAASRAHASPRVAAFLASRPRIAVTTDGQVSSGYDAIEAAPSVGDGRAAYDLDPDQCWTTEERAVLADVMISRWTAYKAMV